MSFSVLSFLNAVFWFNLGLIPIAILQARWKIAMKYSPALLAALAILAGVRVFFPLDSPMFLVIRSHVVLPFLQQVLVYKLFDAVTTWVFAVAVWIVGGSTVLLREFYFCLQDRRTRQGWVHVHNDQVVRAAAALGIPMRIIIVSPQVDIPIASGLLKPRIYLPDADLSHEEWVWILKHERQHLRNGDIWIKFLYLMLEAVFFWNPLMHRMENNLNDLLEFRCDYLLTRNSPALDNQIYLLSILHVLQQSNENSDSGGGQTRSHMCTFIVHNHAESLLVDRVNAVEHPRPKRPFAHTAIAVLGLTLFFASYFVLFQPAELPPTKEISGHVVITAENAYIQKTSTGTYGLWVDNSFFGTVPEEAIKNPPLNQLPIRIEEG